MITGDHPDTAHSVAKSINLITGPTQPEIDSDLSIKVPSGGVYSIIIHGNEIKDFREEDWNMILKFKEIVFARTAPQ